MHFDLMVLAREDFFCVGVSVLLLPSSSVDIESRFFESSQSRDTKFEFSNNTNKKAPI